MIGSSGLSQQRVSSRWILKATSGNRQRAEVRIQPTQRCPLLLLVMGYSRPSLGEMLVLTARSSLRGMLVITVWNHNKVPTENGIAKVSQVKLSKR